MNFNVWELFDLQAIHKRLLFVGELSAFEFGESRSCVLIGLRFFHLLRSKQKLLSDSLGRSGSLNFFLGHRSFNHILLSLLLCFYNLRSGHVKGNVFILEFKFRFAEFTVSSARLFMLGKAVDVWTLAENEVRNVQELLL